MVFTIWWWNPYEVFADSNYTSTSSPSRIRQPLDQQCGGWGKEIRSHEEYEKMKDGCYLLLRQGVLCCIDLPYCPEDFEPEVPLKPYFLFPIKKLTLGCIKTEKKPASKSSVVPKVNVVVCYSDKDKKKH